MANTFDPYNPQHWANESLAILEEKMVFGGLVNRDFEDVLSEYGQVVNTRKPAELSAEPYEKGDTVTVQDASATNVQVQLDTVLDTTFRVHDLESTYSFKNLVEIFMEPAMLAQGRMLDRKISGKASQFLANRVGGTGLLSKTTAHDLLVDAQKQLNIQKAPESGRNIVWAANSDAHLLKTDLFVSAERASDGINTQRNGYLGPKFGMNNFMSLNAPSVSAATKAATTTTTANTAAGDLTVAATAVTNLTKGTYFTVVGDMTVQRVASLASLVVTVTRPFLNATTSGAIMQPYANGATNAAAGFVAGYNKWITVDGTGVPVVGQLVGFQTAGNVLHADEYVIVDVKAVTVPSAGYAIRLDRPLVAALADNDIINYGPNGDLNLAFNKNAITLVNRPMAIPGGISNFGARVGVAKSRHMALRVILSYEQTTKSMLVSVDSLFGIKVLETALGCVVYG